MEIHIKLGKNNIFVTGELFEKKEDVGMPEYFEIDTIECSEKDIADLLEWANSKPQGSVLEYIEELVLKQLK
jgi:hypothetical protein